MCGALLTQHDFFRKRLSVYVDALYTRLHQEADVLTYAILTNLCHYTLQAGYDGKNRRISPSSCSAGLRRRRWRTMNLRAPQAAVTSRRIRKLPQTLMRVASLLSHPTKCAPCSAWCDNRISKASLSLNMSSLGLPFVR